MCYREMVILDSYIESRRRGKLNPLAHQNQHLFQLRSIQLLINKGTHKLTSSFVKIVHFKFENT